MPAGRTIPCTRTAQARAILGRALGPLVMMALAISPLGGQTSYTAANGPTSILPVESGFFGVDFSAVRFGLTVLADLPLACAAGDCTEGSVLAFSLHGSAELRGSQQDLISRLDFNPGYRGAGRVAYRARSNSGRSHTVFGGVAFHTQTRKIVTFTTETTGFLSQLNQKTVSATIGYNLGLSDVSSLGVAFIGRREFGAPGAMLPREFCTPGSDANGFRVLVCADRFVAPMVDLWTAQSRMDYVIELATIGDSPTAPRLALTTAASVDFLEGARADLNLAVGPSIHLSGYRGQPVATLLFGMRDVIDNNNLWDQAGASTPYFGNHFVLGLALAVPFQLVVQ